MLLLPLSYSALADSGAGSGTTVSYPLTRFNQTFRCYNGGSAFNAVVGTKGSYAYNGTSYTTFPTSCPSACNRVIYGFDLPLGATPLFSFKPDTIYTISGKVLVVNDDTCFHATRLLLMVAGSTTDENLSSPFVSTAYVDVRPANDREFSYSFSFDSSRFPGFTDCRVLGVGLEFDKAFTYTNVGLSAFTITEQSVTDRFVDGVGDKIEDQTNQQKGFFEKLGDRIGGFFTDLFNKIMDGLKSLFIPSDGFLETWVTDMQEWLKARFGALYFPIDLTTRFFNAFMSIESSEDISLTFPALQVGEVTLLEEQHYSMSEATGFLGDIYNVYLYVADAIVIVGLVLLLGKKLESILTK